MEILIGLLILLLIVGVMAAIMANAEERRRDEALAAYLRMNQFRAEAGGASRSSYSKMQQASDSYVNQVREVTRR